MNVDQEKISAFEQAVSSETGRKIDAIEQEIKEYENTELREAKEEQYEKMYAYMQSQVQSIKTKFKRELTKFELDSKRDLIEFRNQLSEQVFSQVEDKLEEFTKSPEYKDYLNNQMELALKHFPFQDYVVYIKQEDMVYAPFIEQSFAGAEVQASKTVRLGGFKLENKEHGVLLDYTLEALLLEKKPEYLRQCGLRVEL